MFDIRNSKKLASTTYSLYFKQDGYNRGYAHFTLVHDLGIVHAQTDWGDYCYRWSSYEDSLETFLIDLDSYYVGIKFCGNPKELDKESIKKEIKKDIIKLRRERTIDSDTARECYTDCVDMDLECSVDTYFCTFPTSLYEKIYYEDHSAIPCHRKYTGWQHVFIHEIFPTFQKYLKDQDLTICTGKGNCD